MFTHTTKLQVRYGEVDSMGVVYYGTYALYFEVARVETIRQLGISYKQIEERGYILPVVQYKVKYLGPIEYDDEIEIESSVVQFPDNYKMEFKHKIFVPKKFQNKPLTMAEVLLYVLKKETKKPTQLPQECLDILRPYYQ